MAEQYAELHRYLLASELATLLHFLPDWSQHALINVLWNCGTRINEALSLRRRDFNLTGEIPHVVIRTAARPRKGKIAYRVVPLFGPACVGELRRLLATTKEKFETDAQTGERRALPVWNVTARTVCIWLTRASDDAALGGGRLSIEVSPHTSRHSFAMYHLYGHEHHKLLQALMGHEKYESTEVYTKSFVLGVAASQQMRFIMDISGALQMLRAQPQNP